MTLQVSPIIFLYGTVFRLCMIHILISSMFGHTLKIARLLILSIFVADGISDVELENLKCTIQSMWEKAKSIFEIFIDPKDPALGYRLRVKPGMPIKITVKSEDGFYFGWCADVPESSCCSHLYKRSPVKPNGYMGGPASYCNWAAGKQVTMHLSRPTSRSARFLARLECRNLNSGAELLWNYGCDKQMPLPADDWFLTVNLLKSLFTLLFFTISKLMIPFSFLSVAVSQRHQ